jgi:hypothetical protein
MTHAVFRASLAVSFTILAVAGASREAAATNIENCSWNGSSWVCEGGQPSNLNVAPGQPVAAPVLRNASTTQATTITSHVGNVMNSRAGGRQSASLNETGMASGDPALPFAVWASGGLTSLKNTQAANEFSGSTNAWTTGFDYMPNENLVIGASLARESASLTTDFNSGTVERIGYSLAPYLGYSFGQGTTIDVMAAYTSLHADVTRARGTGFGAYSGWRAMTAANGHHTIHLGDFALRGDLGYLYSHEFQDSYQESGSGQTIASAGINLAQGKVGGRATYALSDYFEPFFQTHYTRDFVRKHISGVAGAGRQPDDNPNEVTLGIGADWYPRDEVSVGFELTHGVVRERDRATSFLFNGRIRF